METLKFHILMLITGKVFGWWLFSMLCMKTSFLKNILNSIAMLIFLNFSQIDLLSFHPSNHSGAVGLFVSRITTSAC